MALKHYSEYFIWPFLALVYVWAWPNGRTGGQMRSMRRRSLFRKPPKRLGNQWLKKELFVIFLKSTSFLGAGATLRDGHYDQA